MERAFFQRTYLDYQADQIERTLYRLNLPVRVDGGSVHPGWVRYHLMPAVGIETPSLAQAMEKLSDEMQVEELRFVPEETGVSLEVPVEPPDGLRLLPLIDTLGTTGPFVAACGMSRTGEPVLVDFSRPDTWNALIIAPPDSGTSELIRTLVMALALNTSPEELLLRGIDLSGNELSVLESTPHNHWRLATNLSSAKSSLEWLSKMCDIHRETGQMIPHLMMVVDDLTNVLDQAPELASNLHNLFVDGPTAGIHLIASVRWPLAGHQQWLADVGGIKATLPGERHGFDDLSPGRFLLSAKGHSIVLDTAWLPARDLEQVVLRLQEQWVAD